MTDSFRPDTLFVVPDELTASTLIEEIFGSEPAMVSDNQVIDFESLVARLTADAMSNFATAESAQARAGIRNVIESDPDAFDYLVGPHSVPRLTQGVLQRIVRSVEVLQNAAPDDETRMSTSPRARQLRLLSDRLEDRLASAGFRLEKYARLEAITGLTQKDWDEHFPAVERVVFLDFLYHSDAVYLTLASANRANRQCDVLLDFDPEDERQASSSLEAAYARLFDMAENLILEPDKVDEETVSSVNQETPVVVSVDTVSLEIGSSAAVIRKLLDDAGEGPAPRIVVVLSDWKQYAPALEKEFDNFEIDAEWGHSEYLANGPECLLLDRVRQCCADRVSGSAISALFRAPGFAAVLQGDEVSGVDAWNLASRLDYVLTFTGHVQGWRAIDKNVKKALARLESDRRRQKQWTDEEGALDKSLLNLIVKTRKALSGFDQIESLEDWCHYVYMLLSRFARLVDLSGERDDGLHLQRLRELKVQLRQTAKSAALLVEKPVSFSYFLSLYSTAIHGLRVDNFLRLTSKSVIVCTSSVAARLRSNCCMILGFNDGNFPSFARPDASLMDNQTSGDQTAARADQRVVVLRIMRNHRRVLMWMPARSGMEDLLPSQFAEEFLGMGSCAAITEETLLAIMEVRREATAFREKRDFVDNLKGLILKEGELNRFLQRGRLCFNVASNISVLASRSRAQLGGFDGIIQEPELLKWLTGWSERHIYSVSQLDAVVGCSFRFFVQRMLNLEELEETDDLLPAHTFGSFTHDVLARFYRHWVADGRGVPSSDDEMLAREKLVEAYDVEHEGLDVSKFAFDLLALKLFGELGRDGFLSSARSFDEINDSGILGQFLKMEMQRGDSPELDFLKPANFEVGFGMGRLEEDDPLTTADHLELDIGEDEHIKLRGRIDRIDLSKTGVFAVTDYKTGHIPEKREILGGYRTQLPVYMMVGERLLSNTYEDAEAAGGLYYSLRKSDKAKVSGIFFRAAYQDKVGVKGRSCLKDDEFDATLEKVRELMRHSLRAVRRGYLTTTRHDPAVVCRYCPFEGFCYSDVERTDRFWQAVDEGRVEEADQ